MTDHKTRAERSCAPLVATTMFLVGCTISVPPVPRDIPMPCEHNEACAPAGTCIGEATGEGRCLRYCWASERCADGAWCRNAFGERLCWDGGETPEGEISPSVGSCAFGLAEQVDYTAEPLAYRCARVCDSDLQCDAGESCWENRCRTPCGDTNPCGALDHCVEGTCVNERRYARLDCDGDGFPDCRAPLQCNPEAIGGCDDAPMGEE